MTKRVQCAASKQCRASRTIPPGAADRHGKFLYSYTMMFRLTGYQNYLLQAGHIADMLLRRLPADGIPYWDFDAPVEAQTYRMLPLRLSWYPPLLS